jgi:hypothetical protein
MTAIKCAGSKDRFIVNRILAPRLNEHTANSLQKLPPSRKSPFRSAFRVFAAAAADNERQHSAFTLALSCSAVCVGSKISHFGKKNSAI